MTSMNRRRFLKAGAVSALTASCAGNVFSAESTPRPNILFLMTDQHRADCLGCAGNSVIKTPNIDRIAREGAMFSSAYTAVPSCTPARSGLLTGLSPWHHGMLGYGRVASRYPVELPRELRNAGYRTLGIGKMHWYPQRNLHGFHQTILDESGRVESPYFESDYRAWFSERAPKNMAFDCTGIGWNDYRAAVYVPPEELHPTVWTAGTAVDWIERYNHDEPFFLKVSFARPHSPYDPPKRFMEAYSEDDMPSPDAGKWADRYKERSGDDFSIWHGDLSVGQAKQSRRGYYGSVSFIDEQIGRILAALEKRGMLENTLILLTADHGDMLGDHHLWRKTYAYEGSVRIPFIVRPPAGTFDNVRGKTFGQPVELRDVLPTFLDAAGAKIPDGLDGRSVLELFRGRTDGWRETIDFEHDECYGPLNHWNALTDGRWKYVYHAKTGEQQLFDLREDSHEEHDYSLETGAQNSARMREWRNRMTAHLAERGEPFVVNGDLAVRERRMLYSPLFPPD